MKTTLTTLVILAAVALGNATYGQDAPEERIKILASNLPGVIKLHYAMPVNEPLHVTFFNKKHRVLSRDKIGVDKNPAGISKRYDVNNISGSDFWIEIRSSKHAVVYHVTPALDRMKFTAQLEQTSNHLLVKGNN